MVLKSRNWSTNYVTYVMRKGVPFFDTIEHFPRSGSPAQAIVGLQMYARTYSSVLFPSCVGRDVV